METNDWKIIHSKIENVVKTIKNLITSILFYFLQFTPVFTISIPAVTEKINAVCFNLKFSLNSLSSVPRLSHMHE